MATYTVLLKEDFEVNGKPMSSYLKDLPVNPAATDDKAPTFEIAIDGGGSVTIHDREIKAIIMNPDPVLSEEQLAEKHQADLEADRKTLEKPV